MDNQDGGAVLSEVQFKEEPWNFGFEAIIAGFCMPKPMVWNNFLGDEQIQICEQSDDEINAEIYNQIYNQTNLIGDQINCQFGGQIDNKEKDQSNTNFAESKIHYNKNIYRRKQKLENKPGCDDYSFEVIHAKVKDDTQEKKRIEKKTVAKKHKMDKSLITKLDRVFRQRSMVVSSLEHDLENVLSPDETKSVLIRDELANYFCDLDLMESEMSCFISCKNAKFDYIKNSQSNDSDAGSYFNLDYIVQL